MNDHLFRIRKLAGIISEVDSTRRGFLKGVGAAASMAALPSGVAGEAIKSLSELPVSKLQALSQIFKVVDIETVTDAVRVYLDSGIISDLISDDEADELMQKLSKSNPNKDPSELYWNFLEDQEEEGIFAVDAVSNALGRPIGAQKIFMILDQYGFEDIEEFFLDDDVLDVIEDAYEAAQTINLDKSSGDTEEESPNNSSTVVDFIKRALNLLIGPKIPQQKPDNSEPETKEVPKQLPAPDSDTGVAGDEISRLGADELDRIQSLAGINSKK